MNSPASLDSGGVSNGSEDHLPQTEACAVVIFCTEDAAFLFADVKRLALEEDLTCSRVLNDGSVLNVGDWLRIGILNNSIISAERTSPALKTLVIDGNLQMAVSGVLRLPHDTENFVLRSQQVGDIAIPAKTNLTSIPVDSLTPFWVTPMTVSERLRYKNESGSSARWSLLPPSSSIDRVDRHFQKEVVTEESREQQSIPRPNSSLRQQSTSRPPSSLRYSPTNSELWRAGIVVGVTRSCFYVWTPDCNPMYEAVLSKKLHGDIDSQLKIGVWIRFCVTPTVAMRVYRDKIPETFNISQPRVISPLYETKVLASRTVEVICYILYCCYHCKERRKLFVPDVELSESTVFFKYNQFYLRHPEIGLIGDRSGFLGSFASFQTNLSTVDLVIRRVRPRDEVDSSWVIVKILNIRSKRSAQLRGLTPIETSLPTNMISTHTSSDFVDVVVSHAFVEGKSERSLFLWSSSHQTSALLNRSAVVFDLEIGDFVESEFRSCQDGRWECDGRTVRPLPTPKDIQCLSRRGRALVTLTAAFRRAEGTLHNHFIHDIFDIHGRLPRDLKEGEEVVVQVAKHVQHGSEPKWTVEHVEKRLPAS